MIFRTLILLAGNLWFTYVTKEDSFSFNGAKIYKSTVYNPNLDVKSGGSYTNLTVLPGELISSDLLISLYRCMQILHDCSSSN